jgi:hypothetical protein
VLEGMGLLAGYWQVRRGQRKQRRGRGRGWWPIIAPGMCLCEKDQNAPVNFKRDVGSGDPPSFILRPVPPSPPPSPFFSLFIYCIFLNPSLGPSSSNPLSKKSLAQFCRNGFRCVVSCCPRGCQMAALKILFLLQLRDSATLGQACMRVASFGLDASTSVPSKYFV